MLSGFSEDKKTVVKSLEKPSENKSYKGTRENKQASAEQQSKSEGSGARCQPSVATAKRSLDSGLPCDPPNIV